MLGWFKRKPTQPREDPLAALILQLDAMAEVYGWWFRGRPPTPSEIEAFAIRHNDAMRQAHHHAKRLKHARELMAAKSEPPIHL